MIAQIHIGTYVEIENPHQNLITLNRIMMNKFTEHEQFSIP